MRSFQAVEDELDQLNLIIKASEPWAKQYEKDPDTHAKLIKIETKLDRKLRRYFRDLSERVPKMVNWAGYMGQIQADFSVNVLIDDSALDDETEILMNFIYDPILDGIYTGAVGGENIYNRPRGITPQTKFVDEAARKQIAGLVGRKVTKDGRIINNPNADYSITETTREQIRKSIATSVSLKENYPDAIKRLSSMISDPARAGMIAQTESVNAYQLGLHGFGVDSGAVGKEWESLNSEDECGDNASAGIISMDSEFPSGDTEPTAHPNCRCSLRLVYPEEQASL